MNELLITIAFVAAAFLVIIRLWRQEMFREDGAQCLHRIANCVRLGYYADARTKLRVANMNGYMVPEILSRLTIADQSYIEWLQDPKFTS